ncbi:MAG: methylated-DNA--[Synergistaceae bacterium]|nr:methylated-DNA--[protein]-cysteine S-methyltransferase [Synergistaceae bacterium]
MAAKLNTSPRAVGRALSQNHILIVIPCHRVIGANNNLTGYNAGVERKKKLLAIEEQII